MKMRIYSSDLYKHVSKRTNVDAEEVRRILENTWDVIEHQVGKNNVVCIIGFGVFERTILRARMIFGRWYSARKNVRFRPGSSFRNQAEGPVE